MTASDTRFDQPPKMCFDRILPRDLDRPGRTSRAPGGATRGIGPKGKTWMNGSTLKVRFMGGTDEERAVAREQAGWWSEVANLTFEFGDAPQADIRIIFEPWDGAWSMIGTDARSVLFNQPTMNLGFLDGGTAAHEFGHAIGLAHEHASPLGGIEWDEDAVFQYFSGPPNNWDEATTRHNVLFKYSMEQINGTDFDPESIMLYHFPAEFTVNGVGTDANEVLSQMDREFIAGAKMYPKDKPGVEDAEVLTIGGARFDGAIGKPGEEDLYRFTVDSQGTYVMDTEGETDVYMKLFGPDNPTSLIEEDDDGGFGLNPRISTSLLPGEYHLQLRHYDRSSGTGSYSVGVAARTS